MRPARAGQQGVGGQPHAVQGDVALDRRAHRQLRLDRRGGEALASRSGTTKPRDAVVGLRPDDRDVRDRGQPDPALRAGEHPPVPVADGAGGHAPRVAAGGRLGQPEAADQLAGGHAGQPPLLLLLGAELRDRAHRQRALHRDERADARSRRPPAPSRPGRTRPPSGRRSRSPCRCMPSRPSAAISLTSSRGKVAVAYQPAMFGRIRSSTKARTRSRSASSSAENRPSRSR